MDLVGGRGDGRVGRVVKVGVTPCHLFLHGPWPGCIDGPSLDAGGIRHPDWVV